MVSVGTIAPILTVWGLTKNSGCSAEGYDRGASFFGVRTELLRLTLSLISREGGVL
jgi:hypothetical protein